MGLSLLIVSTWNVLLRLFAPPMMEKVGVPCPSCDYRIDNIPSPRCPECGADVSRVPRTLQEKTVVKPRPVPGWVAVVTVALGVTLMLPSLRGFEGFDDRFLLLQYDLFEKPAARTDLTFLVSSTIEARSAGKAFSRADVERILGAPDYTHDGQSFAADAYVYSSFSVVIFEFDEWSALYSVGWNGLDASGVQNWQPRAASRASSPPS